MAFLQSLFVPALSVFLPFLFKSVINIDSKIGGVGDSDTDLSGSDFTNSTDFNPGLDNLLNDSPNYSDNSDDDKKDEDKKDVYKVGGLWTVPLEIFKSVLDYKRLLILGLVGIVATKIFSDDKAD